MKILKSTFLALISLIYLSCSGDDDNSNTNNLLSIGTCGEFFEGVNLTSLCGVETSNAFSTGSELACTYTIAPNENVSATQEFIYTASLISYPSINQTETIYNGLKDEYFPGEMLEPTSLNGIGDEAVFGVETDGNNEDATLLFRFKNVIAVLTTEEDILTLGCDDMQLELEKLAELILEKL